MPYSTEDKAPIQHDLFDRFLQHKEDGGKPNYQEHIFSVKE